jgi:hypothetical protein
MYYGLENIKATKIFESKPKRTEVALEMYHADIFDASSYFGQRFCVNDKNCLQIVIRDLITKDIYVYIQEDYGESIKQLGEVN